MMTKSKTFTFLAALFLTCFIFSRASPLPSFDGGEIASVTLKKLDGKFKFTQINEISLKVEAVINSGIKDKDPHKYFVQFLKLKVSFADLNIIPKPPGIVPWEKTLPGVVDIIVGTGLSIFYEDEVLDSGIIIKS
ncbi:hypothetical protein Glove_13g102 [Diversispora epigaea]|uniref:Uncharacterized protein n=1 Tax=Diversispora epigaea TaxID=1348612 RepID=A0A397JQJ1_9GLOM|nr:hypothetical protein Glove_13g102 [Diversispora epigaea]